MSRHSRFFSSALSPMLVALAVASCGKPKATQPRGNPLVVPEYPSKFSLNLAEDGLDHTYSGALVIWNPDVKGEQISRVLSATRTSNEAYTQYIKAVDESVATKAEPLKQLETAVRELDARSNERLRDAQIGRASTWFDEQIDAAGFSDEQKTHARGVFRAYCDSQIWALAVDPFFVKNNFRARPTPSAICERAQMYIDRFSGDECAPSAEGKSYMKCLWEVGVKSTIYYKAYDSRPEQKARVDALIAHEKFGSVLAGEVPGCSVPLGQTLMWLKGVYNPDGTIVRGWKCDAIDSNPFAFGLPLTEGRALNDAPETSNPKTVIEAFRSLSTVPGPKDAFRIVRAADTAIAEQGAAITRQIVDLHAEAKAACPGIGNMNINMKRFNLPFLVGPNVGVACTEEAANLPDIFVEDVELAAKKNELLAVREALAQSKGTLCPTGVCDANDTRPLCVWQRAQENRLAPIEEPGVRLSLVKDMSVQTSREAGIVKLKLSFDGRVVGVACRAEGESAWGSCSASSEPSMQADFEGSSRKLTLSLPVDDRFFQGTISGERTPMYENFDRFRDRSLHIELFPNAFESTVPYLSGKATIRDGSTEVYQGSASYLIDLTTVDHKRKALCQ